MPVSEKKKVTGGHIFLLGGKIEELYAISEEWRAICWKRGK